MRAELSNQLFSTKLFVPPARETLAPRPRLVRRLNQGLELPLTLVSAPAGYGKTTLLSEWRLSNPDYPLAWISLDDEDNDPERFLSYLDAALESLKPGLAKVAPGLLQSPQPPSLQLLLAGLIHDLSQVEAPFALALDDYHAITTQTIHLAIAYLLDHMPPAMHLVLITRSDPPLPLPRLRVRGQLAEIRLADLRFTPEEAAAFLNQGMGLALSPDEVQALEQRTEGWIAALQLAALALQQPRAAQEAESVPAFIAAFRGSHHYVADYLSAEALERQSAEVRAFLLQTSILERMTGELCDAVTGRCDGQEMLLKLDRANLFVEPLDGQRRWYRYHPLFADLLRSRLQQEAAEQISALHHRASGWYRRGGFVTAAIHHALAAGDTSQVAELIEQHAMTWLLRGDAVTVMNWIRAAGPEVEERPWLGVYQSWARIITGEVEPIEARLRAAEGWIKAHAQHPDALPMRSQIAAIRAFVAERGRAPQQAITLARQALEWLPDEEAPMRSLVTFLLGDASWSTGDLAGALQAFDAVRRIDQGSGSPLLSVLAVSSSAILLSEQGELHQAEETFRNAIDIAAQTGGRRLPAIAVAHQGLANLAYEWNSLAAAAEFAQQALELGQRLGNPDTLANTYLVQARILLAQGEHGSALGALRQAESLARGQGVTPWSSLRIDALRVRLWLERGDLKAADAWAQRVGLDPMDEIRYPRQTGFLSLARILLAQQQTGALGGLLGRLQKYFERLALTGHAIEVCLLQSLAFRQQGNLSAAVERLSRALALGEPEDYTRTFLDEGEPLAELLRHAASRGISVKYAARLLAEFERSDGVPPEEQQPLVEPLSARELEVLRLMADGYSNQAIAVRLVVALGTVKAHTASLYRKLGVNSRTQAVARSRELALL